MRNPGSGACSAPGRMPTLRNLKPASRTLTDHQPQAREIPLVAPADPARAVAWRNGERVRLADFLGDVAALARRLPEQRYMLYLCEDRYRFLVAF